MGLELMLNSLLLGFLAVISPLITTFKISKNKLSPKTYVSLQKYTLIFQFLFTALTVSAISYQLFVKRKINYESNTIFDLSFYSFGLIFTIYNLVYFQTFITDSFIVKEK